MPDTPARTTSPAPANSSTSLSKIQHVIVLMLENRSFDHLLGFLKSTDPRIAGLTGAEACPQDPGVAGSPAVAVSRAASFAMPFDPGHEFPDVQMQLYAPSTVPVNPAAMQGFVKSALAAAQPFPTDAPRIMECFQPDQIPVLCALVQQFAVFNFYYSALPGPTWPNRFFIHAATSGGLTDSPNPGQILGGYSFRAGTIYDALQRTQHDWRIYHDGLPQSVGIDTLRLSYIDPFTTHFREMDFFAQDVAAESLPEYTFIEPNYDLGHNYRNGNSMHPLNDIREGEKLLKRVYETLRNSSYWDKMMLVVTFDEHGGFYDHVPPAPGLPTGDDLTYANPARPFQFDRLGVRVPAIVVSAYTRPGTVIGEDPTDPTTTFDHSSVLATVEKRFSCPALTARDRAANTLDVALNLSDARDSDAPKQLPDPAPDNAVAGIVSLLQTPASAGGGQAPLSRNQQSLLALALACDMKVSRPSDQADLRDRHLGIDGQADAAAYVAEVENKIHANRHQTLT